MPNKKVTQTIVFFPLMELTQTYQLRYGEIGPTSQLILRHPIIERISPALMRTTLDGDNITDPVVAISTISSQKLIAELEFLSFQAACDHKSRAEEEIFGQKTQFVLCEKKNEINVDNHTILSPIEALQTLRSQDFPRSYFRWDKKAISDFEDFFANTLTTDLYLSLTKCLEDINDKETIKDRSRIIISILLFNQAYIDYLLFQPFSKNRIILIASAFEALFNLPSENINKNFKNAVMIHVGGSTSLLRKWCVDFYSYRSGLVHGDIIWEDQEKEYFALPDGEQIDHMFIANRIFVRSLKTKLFLIGLLSNYKWEDFSFDDLIKP